MGWRRLQRGGRDSRVMDPGLQIERTAISWQRTALSVGAFAALLLHSGGSRPLARLPGSVGLVVSLLLLLVAERRYVDSVLEIRAASTPASARVMRRVTAAVTLLGALALALILAMP